MCVLVVRLWLEPSDDAERGHEWRGDVRHVLSGKTTYFRHHDGVVGAIRKLCSQLDEAAAAHDEAARAARRPEDGNPDR